MNSAGTAYTGKYDPGEYWTGVANQIQRRSGDRTVAGDASPFYVYKRRMLLAAFTDAIDVEGKTVLEVGCGPGGNLLWLESQRPSLLVGCDVSRGMVELARSNTRGSAIQIHQTNGTDLPFSSNGIQVSFTVTVLQHNDDAVARDLLLEMCRVTRDRIYLYEDTGPAREEKFSFVLRPVQDYAAICAGQGFALIATRPMKVSASEALARALRVAFNQRKREGAAVSAAHSALERGAMLLTTALDKIVPSRRGLTQMVFERR